MKKPIAVLRRNYTNNSGPSIYGMNRMDKVVSPKGETFVFLGVRDGEVFLEREAKTPNTEPFLIVDSVDFSKWHKKQ